LGIVIFLRVAKPIYKFIALHIAASSMRPRQLPAAHGSVPNCDRLNDPVLDLTLSGTTAMRTGVVDDVVFARQHSRLRDVWTMFAERPPADEELGVRGLGCAIASNVCPTDGVRVRLMLDRVQPNANSRRTRRDFRRQ
jgi:hypothetical protein